MDRIESKFDTVFYTVGFVSKMELDCKQPDIIAGLQAARKVLGRGELEASSKDDRVDLADRQPVAGDKRFELAIMQKRAVLFAMEKGFGAEERGTTVRRVFQALAEHLTFMPAALDYIDKKISLTKKTSVNPEPAFARIIDQSPLGELLEGHQLYSFRPAVLFAADDEGTRICRLQLESDITVAVAKAGKTREPCKIEIECSIGQIGRLDAITDMVEAIMSHLEFSRAFISREIVPCVFQPILEGLDVEEGSHA